MLATAFSRLYDTAFGRLAPGSESPLASTVIESQLPLEVAVRSLLLFDQQAFDLCMSHVRVLESRNQNAPLAGKFDPWALHLEYKKRFEAMAGSTSNASNAYQAATERRSSSGSSGVPGAGVGGVLVPVPGVGADDLMEPPGGSPRKRSLESAAAAEQPTRRPRVPVELLPGRAAAEVETVPALRA